MAALKIQWKLIYTVQKEVLTPEQVTSLLASTPKLSSGEIPSLNRVLNRVLWRFLVTVDRAQLVLSQEKGEAQFDAALKSIADMYDNGDDAIKRLQSINVRSTSGKEVQKLYDRTIKFLQIARDVSRDQHSRLSNGRDVGLRFSLKDYTDRRRRQDIRHQIVFEGLIQFWQEAVIDEGFNASPNAGAPPKKDKAAPPTRGGPLVRFIGDVVEMVTDPPMRLDPETIMKDIATYRKAEAAAKALKVDRV